MSPRLAEAEGGQESFFGFPRPSEKVVARSGVLTARRGVAALSACLRIGLLAGVDMNHVRLFAPLIRVHDESTRGTVWRNE
jgi:hypothetical protein